MEQRKEGDFIVTILPPGQPAIFKGPISQVIPTELFILPEGDINDEPSLMFISSAYGSEKKVISQISLGMFNDALPDGAKLTLNLDPEKYTTH